LSKLPSKVKGKPPLRPSLTVSENEPEFLKKLGKWPF
jgi:hypothetical protein